MDPKPDPSRTQPRSRHGVNIRTDLGVLVHVTGRQTRVLATHHQSTQKHDLEGEWAARAPPPLVDPSWWCAGLLLAPCSRPRALV